MLGIVGVAAVIVTIAAVTRRPGGPARAWMVVVPAAVVSLSGFAFAGCLAGPGACLTVTLMLTGLLLGRRSMIWLMVACAAILQRGAIGFVQKPYRIAELSRVVAEAMRR